jgi:hypothetical protein
MLDGDWSSDVCSSDLADLRKAVAYERLLEKRRDSFRKPRRDEGLDEGKCEEIREALLEFKLGHPDAGRTQLIQEFGRLAIWSRDNDAAWYDETFPPKRRGLQTQSPEETAEKWRAFDKRTSDYIFKHRQRLISARGQPKKVTKTLLLKGTPRGNEVSWRNVKRMPLTEQALKHCIETSSEYKIRYAHWLLDGLPNSDDLWHQVRDRTGLPLTAISRLSYRPGSRKRN